LLKIANLIMNAEWKRIRRIRPVEEMDQAVVRITGVSLMALAMFKLRLSDVASSTCEKI
jgi:hypothetical protein